MVPQEHGHEAGPRRYRHEPRNVRRLRTQADGVDEVKGLRPFFSFYGGKWRAAPRYPSPRHGAIVEPFAGSAGYSLRYPSLSVTLVERDPVIASVWRYLLSVTPIEIMALPNVAIGQDVQGLNVCAGARNLIGFWLTKGGAAPNRTLSAWGRRPEYAAQFWGRGAKVRIASQLDSIRHWVLIEGTYSDAPDADATWFIDPPYAKAGKHYRFGAASIDYEALGRWCRSRTGQAIVCENDGAGWLPFRHFADIKANESRTGGKVSRESIWEGGK